MPALPARTDVLVVAAGPVRRQTLDGATMTVRESVPLGSESFTTREAPDGASVCVADGAPGTVSVVDLVTLTETRTLTIPPSRDFPFSGTHGLSLVT